MLLEKLAALSAKQLELAAKKIISGRGAKNKAELEKLLYTPANRISKEMGGVHKTIDKLRPFKEKEKNLFRSVGAKPTRSNAHQIVDAAQGYLHSRQPEGAFWRTPFLKTVNSHEMNKILSRKTK